MADKVTIVNRALALLGAEPIINLTDDTPEANIASRFYDESRKSILSEVLWNFAAKRVLLNQAVVTPAWIKDNQNYVFQMPSDVIRIFGISSDNISWRLEGEYIYADSDEFGILYVWNMTDTTKFSASFVDAFADKLASDMAYDITNSNTAAKELLEKYDGVSLPKATAENSQTGTPAQINDNLWVYAKYGYTPVNSGGIRIA